MIRTLVATSLALLFAAAAHAGPVQLSEAQMDEVTAGGGEGIDTAVNASGTAQDKYDELTSDD